MEKLTCQNCGGPLTKSGKCEYCGTIYQINQTFNEICYVEVQQGPVETIICKTEVPKWFVEKCSDKESKRALADRTLRELREELAEGIAGFMEVRTEIDPFSEAQIYQGMIRVVPPGFRF